MCGLEDSGYATVSVCMCATSKYVGDTEASGYDYLACDMCVCMHVCGVACVILMCNACVCACMCNMCVCACMCNVCVSV